MSGFGLRALAGIKYLHFIGIYGISMSSLAIVCARLGYTVSGSDTGSGDEHRRRALMEAGIKLKQGNAPENLPINSQSGAAAAVVYTAAVTESDRELSAARGLGWQTFGRAEFMELLTREFPLRIGVSGTHGKSTVCGMIAEIYLAAGFEPDVLCGAELSSLGGAFRIGSGQRVVYEACEYKNSFLNLRPTHAIVTNIEEEHTDFFKSIEETREAFFEFTDRAERAVICVDSVESGLLAARLGKKAITCSAYSGVRGKEQNAVSADYYAEDIRVDKGLFSFSLYRRGEYLAAISLMVPGRHNLQNAVTAAALASETGVPMEFIAIGLGRFSGVKRRMEYRGTLNGAVIYDDYAHHPTEIKATLAAARSMGFKRIYCAFQPHTYSRTAHFMREFAHAFADADQVAFADIYAAREQNVYGVSSQELAGITPNGIYLPTAELIAEYFRRIAAPDMLLLTMGAGELNRVADLL